MKDVRLGVLDIVLPTASDARCYFMHDLAGLFGLETNSEARDLLLARWRSAPHKGRLDVDHESDFVIVSAGRDSIVSAAILVHEIAGRPLDDGTIEPARAAVRKAKRPPRVAWVVGDIFAVPLGDGTFSFGQVLFEQKFATGSRVRAPTCVLLEHRAADLLSCDPTEILTSRSLAIFHELSTALDAAEWTVVGHAEPCADPRSGRCGIAGEVGSTSGGMLAGLARAYWGTEPWNVMADERYWDKLLLRGVERPPQANVLSPEARTTYRRTVFALPF
jgi:hypothetical protein